MIILHDRNSELILGNTYVRFNLLPIYKIFQIQMQVIQEADQSEAQTPQTSLIQKFQGREKVSHQLTQLNIHLKI